MATLVTLAQPPNAHGPMMATLSGSVTAFRAVQQL
jgi:hypothetical protein